MPAPEQTPSTSPPQLGAEGRILEGIVTTINADGSVNISPMGPLVDDALDRLWLRPYQTSTTYQNLKRTGVGVFHITDDVELLAHAAVGQPDPLPRMHAAEGVAGMILSDACRWYAFEVESLDDSAERTSIVCRIVATGCQRGFLGFNRAKHAVLEAAILATRVHMLDASEIQAELAHLAIPIEKTGAAAEHRAFKFLLAYVHHMSQE
jgi:uncharacterized protein